MALGRPEGWRISKLRGYLLEHASISAAVAKDLLDVPDNHEARQRLMKWARAGKLRRVARGLYGLPTAAEKAVA
jgi:hypothetical protein